MNTLDSAEENTRTVDIQYKKYDHISHVETPTISYTETPSVTHTPTMTFTPTVTDTYTPTETFSNTPTVSYTETAPTPTVSYTETAPTPTVSYTETAPTPTVSYTETAPTPTISYTPTITSTYTPTITFSGTPTITDSSDMNLVYDVYDTSGKMNINLKSNTSYSFHILGAAGTPAQYSGQSHLNNKGAFISFDILGDASKQYIGVIGGVSTSINYGAGGSGGSPWGAANGGFVGGGFSGLFTDDITPANAIGVAGGSGAASAGENSNYARKGGPGRGQISTSSSSMQGGTGQNAYYNGNSSAKAGGGGGGGGFTGGSGGNMGEENVATGGQGGTSYVISSATNTVIEGAPDNTQFPTAWNTLKTELNIDNPLSGVMIIGYQSTTARETTVNNSYIKFAITLNYQNPTWYVNLYNNTNDDTYTIYHRSQNISINGSGGLYNNFIDNIKTIENFEALGGVTKIENITSNWSQTLSVPWAKHDSNYNLNTNYNQTQFIVVNNTKKTMYKYAFTHYSASNDNDARSQAGRYIGGLNPQSISIDHSI